MSNSTSTSTSLTDFAQSIFSYNSNVMLAALISLLLVVLFVLLLHAYAKCFFPQPRRLTHPRPATVTVSYLLRPDSVAFDSGAPSKGLEPSAISAIPLFVYEADKQRAAGNGMECVICLGEFQERELGRRLPKCSHGFHLQCIDMWLNSHSNCPVCRAAVVSEPANSDAKPTDGAVESGDREVGVEIVMDGRSCESESTERINAQSHATATTAAAAASSSSSSSSSFDPPSMSLGASLKRMLSRNKSEGRIFPSSTGGTESDV